jgi:hypothetical protein
MKLVGIILIVLGVLALVYQSIQYTTKQGARIPMDYKEELSFEL